ncbi:hypothetical protein PAMA_008083 [Pampus argenteus]
MTLILYVNEVSAAHNSGAPGLSAPAVRTESLLSGLQMSPQPRRAICRFPQVGVGQGRDGGESGVGLLSSAKRGQSGRVWLVWAGCRDVRGPEYHLVSCQLLSGLLFVRRHLVKVW